MTSRFMGSDGWASDETFFMHVRFKVRQDGSVHYAGSVYRDRCYLRACARDGARARYTDRRLPDDTHVTCLVCIARQTEARP